MCAFVPSESGRQSPAESSAALSVCDSCGEDLTSRRKSVLAGKVLCPDCVTEYELQRLIRGAEEAGGL